MENELERMIEDRDTAENDIIRLEEYLGTLEDDPEEDHPDHEAWNSTYHEINELTNEASYLTACIESFKEFGEI